VTVTAVQPLPRSLDPLPGESLAGFLLRLAHRLDLAPGRVAVLTGLGWTILGRSNLRVPAGRLLHLDAGDPEQANWAARRGLAASPYDERLYRVLMRAAHAAGNPAGVDAVWNELLSVLDADLELIDDELHPETVALYTTLRPRGRRRPTGPQQPRSSIPQN